MNYSEAKEIYDKGNPPFVNDRFNYCKALGYLEAHAEVEKLIKALEKIIQKYPEGFDYLYNGEEVRGIARDILEKWRQSNGVGKP